MNITEHEMRGLLAGKCLPGDMRLNEELPAYLVRKFAEIKAQRDALAENEGYKQAFYEMAEILGIGARVDSPKNVFELVIKPKIEALMKERGRLASENITLANLVTSWPQERCPVTEAVTDVQPDDLFPETSAYLNSVRAEGVEMFANHCLKRRGEMMKTEPNEAVVNQAITATRRAGEFALHFAAQLRAGEPS